MTSNWIVFNSRTRVSMGSTLGAIRPDGSGLHFLDLDVPGQVTWGHGPCFSDGERIIVTSFDTEKTWQSTCRSTMWIYNLRTGELTRIAEKNRVADFLPPLCPAPRRRAHHRQPHDQRKADGDDD